MTDKYQQIYNHKDNYRMINQNYLILFQILKNEDDMKDKEFSKFIFDKILDKN